MDVERRGSVRLVDVTIQPEQPGGNNNESKIIYYFEASSDASLRAC